MKKTAFMIALVAVLAVFMFGLSSAATVVSSEAIVSVDGIELNHQHNNLTLATFAGETVPVRVYFTAVSDAKDVKVEVELSSGNYDSSDSFFVGNVINDSRVYRTGVMNIDLPANLKDTTKDLYLRVTITADGFNTYSTEYAINVQRNSYQLDVLSLDFDNTVSAGQTVPVSVVIKNRGFENSDDGFVTVSIPELGISAKGYFGDLVAIEDCSDDCNKDDSVMKVLNLRIPDNAKAGVYNMVVKVYDAESVTTVTDAIKVDGSVATQVVTTQSSQDIKTGETKTYDLILVNSGDNVAVYRLSAVSGSELSVSVPTVVTVDAGSSKTVQVTVTAASDADKGVYPFIVDVNGDRTTFNANVTGNSLSVSTIALTVVLVIVFVVLLVVLIVLLTKKDKPAEEVETSYY
ncbi:hypothetical protein KA107_00385 [Candidatus Pacearchaeota archaeon]|nr:hypothetical protein [Candidatus Pacearchaeota archaeon]